MTTETRLQIDSETTLNDRRRRFTVTEYHALCEKGVLLPEERTELLDGEIFTMAPIGPMHGWIGDQLFELIGLPAHAAGLKVRFGLPIDLSPRSEPQPDFYVFRTRKHEYRTSHPTAADIVLLVEISETSLHYDRNVKTRLYAEAGLPEYWIIDVRSQRVIVFKQPSESGYRSIHEYVHGETVTPNAIPSIRLAVGDLVPGMDESK